MLEATPIDVTGSAPVEGVAAAVTEVDEVKKPEETKDDSAERFAQLSRREKLLRAQKRELEAKEIALRAREEALAPKPQPEVSWKDRLKQDPMGLLAEAGMTYDDMVNNLLTQNPQDQSLRLIQQELKTIREDNIQLRQHLEQKEEASVKQALNQLRYDAEEMAKSYPDEYESILAAGEPAYQLIADEIEQYYYKHGKVLDLEKAATKVEKFLEDSYVEFAKLKKIQKRLTPSQEAAQAEVQSAPVKAPAIQTTPKSTNTLSHTMTTSARAPLSDRERKQRAILAFQGKLQG